jgi:hypothetical protein
MDRMQPSCVGFLEIRGLMHEFGISLVYSCFGTCLAMPAGVLIFKQFPMANQVLERLKALSFICLSMPPKLGSGQLPRLLGTNAPGSSGANYFIYSTSIAIKVLAGRTF